jgi:hypothetical protein
VELLLLRQRDSIAAPVWQAERVSPLMVLFFETKTRWKGLDWFKYCALVEAARPSAMMGSWSFIFGFAYCVLWEATDCGAIDSVKD